MVRVDHASLRVAANDVTTTYDDTKTNLTSLRSLISDLSGTWKGQASTGFQGVMDSWDREAQKLLTALDGIAVMLGQSADTHQVNDEEQANTMNKYGNGLNC